MTSRFRLLMFGILITGGATAAFAAPLPPMNPVTIEGSISQAQWSPDTKVKGRPGFSGSLGVDRTVPAHFRIKLVDFSGLDKAVAWRINGIMSDPSSNPNADRRQPPPHLILQLNDKDPQALKPGMRIRVREYVVNGDEGGTWTRFTKLEVISKPAEDKQAALPNVRRWDFLILVDFSGFGIGRKIYLKRDATCIQQSFDRSMRERRHEFRVPAEELQAIEQLLVKHRFWDIKTNERRGYLDEGRPSIIVHLDSGPSREVAKWSADKHSEFDPIYDRLRNLTRFADEKNKTYEGPRNYDWRPSGFEISADAGATDATAIKK